MKLFSKYGVFFALTLIQLFSVTTHTKSKNIDSLKLGLTNASLNNQDRVKLLLSIYQAYEDAEKYTEGKPYLDTALQVVLNEGDRKGVADVKVKLGIYYLFSDNYTEAQRLFVEAKRIYKFENATGRSCTPLKYLGLIESLKKNFQDALAFYDESIKEANKGHYVSEAFTAQYLKALALTQIDSLNQAFSILNFILKQPDSITGDQRRMEATVGIGDIFMHRNLYDSAAFYYRLAFNFFDKKKNISAISYAGSKLANTYLKQNKIDSALRIGIRSFNIADSIKDITLRFESSKIISDAYFYKNNYKEAYYFLNIYDSLKEEKFNIETEKKFLLAKLRYQQADYLTQQRAAETYVLQQKKIKNAFLAGLVLATLLLIVSLFGIVQNRRKNKELTKSNNEVQQALVQLQNTQEQLIRQEKLASLGQMVAGIAHEMQNPLNFVNNFAESSVILAKEIIKTNDHEHSLLIHEMVENLGRIQEHGNRASSIVKNMLLYSRNETFAKQKTDINNMLNDFISLAYEGFRSTDVAFSCRIEKNYSELPLVLCSPQNLSRVILNLLSNALYAVNEKKKFADQYYIPVVSITTRLIDGAAEILIRDNGSGIPDFLKEKIFEPFFTTKPAGKGTGLGLSLSYDLIKAHGGILNVESKVGIFTQFTISLPLS